MKILVIGGTGTIGQAVVQALRPRHQVIIAGATRGDIQIDITSKDSIENVYREITNLDAVILATGKAHFGRLAEITEQEFQIGIQNKLMGQINVVLIGMKYLNPKGSFTLTSGVLNQIPILTSVNAAVANGGLEGFVKSAALDLPDEMRINVVSPTILEGSASKYQGYFSGFDPVSPEVVGLAYAKSVEGTETGQVYRVGYAV